MKVVSSVQDCRGVSAETVTGLRKDGIPQQSVRRGSELNPTDSWSRLQRQSRGLPFEPRCSPDSKHFHLKGQLGISGDVEL
jgi:hypothetical protein